MKNLMIIMAVAFASVVSANAHAKACTAAQVKDGCFTTGPLAKSDPAGTKNCVCPHTVYLPADESGASDTDASARSGAEPEKVESAEEDANPVG